MRSNYILLATTMAIFALPFLPVEAAEQTMFGRMFPDLPAYTAPSDEALTALTCGQDPASPSQPSPLCTLQTQVLPTGPKMGPLFDQNIAAPTAPNDDNPNDVPSFFTYFGQFLDHDMTLDILPLPTTFVDPNTIPNMRDPRLNLDSVYGEGPLANPELYEADRKHLKVNGRDLPRNSSCVVVPPPPISNPATPLPPCSAIINEKRNDENQVIAQIHVSFLRAHNALIDQGYNLVQAREIMKWRYQWIVVHEFLPEVLDANIYADVFRPDGSIQTKYYGPNQAFRAVMPVEFAVAAYRFGHSQVRRAYIITQFDNTVAPTSTNPIKLQVFNNTANDLHGGRQIATDHVIFWPNFLPIDGQPLTGQFGTNQSTANISRKIDTLLSSGLFLLPIPGAEPEGSVILAKRNIQRARSYGLPSGQSVARHLQNDDQNIHVYTNAEIASAIPRLSFLNNPQDPHYASYLGEVPLWLYVLAESQIVHDGVKLGPVGSRIVAEVIGGLLASDVRSYYRRNWVPDGGVFRAQDLLREAGVLPLN